MPLGNWRFREWTFLVSPAAMVLGVGVASGVGIFFGFYPACQADRHGPREPGHRKPGERPRQPCNDRLGKLLATELKGDAVLSLQQLGVVD